MKTFNIGLTHDFEEVLSARERELCAVLDASDKKGVAETEAGDRHDVTDFKDLATGQSNAAVDEAQAEQAALELERVLAARRRLQDRIFGFCLDCKEPIDLRRLTAMPATAYCKDCQSAREGTTAPAVSH